MVVSVPEMVVENNLLVPRTYQAEMSKWMYETRRVINKDWPGLGKTLEAGNATKHFPALIVCRKHAMGQWADFLTTQYPHTKVGLCVGTRKQRQAVLDDHQYDWYIINHAMLATYNLPTNILTFIGDEAQAFRNRNSTQARAAFEFVNSKTNPVPYVYLLTANPGWKSVDDVWMLINILYPKIVPPYREFVDMFCYTDNAPWGPRVLGVRKSMKAELQSMLRPISWGRTYKDVGRYLPTKIESIVNVPFTSALRKIYADTKQTYRLKLYNEEDGNYHIDLSSSALLHTLRRITCNPDKIEAIRQIVEDNQKLTLVGMWYKEHAQLVYEALGGRTAAYLLTGEVDALERTRIAVRAQREGKHVVATEASLTDSINLQGFRQVIFGEEHYAPGANYQFLSRVVRDRNDDGADTEPVLVYYVHVPGSIDKIIHRVATRRQGSIKEIIAEALV